MFQAKAGSNDRLGLVGLAISLLGIAATALVWLTAPDFWVIAPTALLPQAAACVLGFAGWRTAAGKVAAVASGTLFLLLGLFFSLVLLLVLSIQYSK